MGKMNVPSVMFPIINCRKIQPSIVDFAFADYCRSTSEEPNSSESS